MSGLQPSEENQPTLQQSEDGEPLERQISEHVRLPCLVLLDEHFARGGVSPKGYQMLHRMAEYISAIGWECHLIYQSKMATARSVHRIGTSMRCILEGCALFHAHMEKATVRVREAAYCLPLLDQSDLTLKTKLTQWHWKLKTLHEPTGHDRRLFIAIRDHYKDVFDRLVELNYRKHAYNLFDTVDKAIDVFGGLHRMVTLAREADRDAKSLHKEFKTAAKLLAERHATKKSKPPSRASSDNLPASKYQAAMTQSQNKLSSAFSKSFGVAEEEIARTRHGRSSTLMAPNNTIVSDKKNQAGSSSGEQNTTIRRPRRGSSTLRIFTGSLSELENRAQMLQLHKVRTPESNEDKSRVSLTSKSGSGLTPVDCRGSSPPPSLQRREAFVSKETEVHNRVIKGEIVSSRRPSTKDKAQPDLDALAKRDSPKLPEFHDLNDSTPEKQLDQDSL